MTCHAQKQRLSTFDNQVLDLSGTWITGLTQDENTPVRVLEEGFERISAQIGVDGNRTGSELVEDRPGVRAHGLRGVAALGVNQDRDITRQPFQECPQCHLACQAKGLEERDVGFVAAHQVACRIDDGAQEARHPAGRIVANHLRWGQCRIRIEADAQPGFVLPRRGVQAFQERGGRQIGCSANPNVPCIIARPIPREP